ncbi:MAG TPA: hypothetical protein PLD38_10665 [Pyrinomonadaceae bacterium]|nr:hypothetical protein [Chloracidobacterium sp.]MBP9934460.1 hypothetical protein [Pyrinomonadaceae bacterium]MBK7802557.1 hypothetical protein [Chloracidobacterium sp.]MBK9437412.1 hypothetical protein [Chloracidobacterium sp.]MBL0240082.1 hypothetical protein [Chloracidobacterium sp.]
MKFNYLVILAIMAVACYFLFIRKPKGRVTNDNDAGQSAAANDPPEE